MTDKLNTLVELKDRAASISRCLGEAATTKCAEGAMEAYDEWERAAEGAGLDELFENAVCLSTCISKYYRCVADAPDHIAFSGAPDDQPGGSGPKKTFRMCYADFRMCVFMCSANKIITVLR